MRFQNLSQTTLRLLAVATILGTGIVAVRADELDLIETPRFGDIKTRILEEVALRKIADQAINQEVGQLWSSPDEVPPASEIFNRVITTFRLIDPAANDFLTKCRLSIQPRQIPVADLIDNTENSKFYRTNLIQFYAVYLVRMKLYDESLPYFDQLNLKHSADPPTALFHQAVAQSELLMKNEGLATIETLTKKTEAVPERYATVAELMKFQLASIKEESLDEVAQRMKDVKRRLSLGRGGQDTQKKEEEIVTLLDSIIEKIEQSSGSGGGSGAGGNSNQPGGGSQESVVKGTSAPGEVDKKDLKKQSGWGALPEAEVTKAKNLLKRDFPENYRRAIEAYFRKSAGRRPE
ncbi:MAG: hypothetical protein P8M30_10930 [Planctomycetaceae bacterium]|nr:hypothetical protein [Planctomycetaceae bacterium]